MIVDNLSKKQKFIILTVVGSIIVFGLFIWSMVINLSQFSLYDNIPKVNLSNNEIDSNESINETDEKSNQIEQDTELDLDKILKQ